MPAWIPDREASGGLCKEQTHNYDSEGTTPYEYVALFVGKLSHGKNASKKNWIRK